MTTTNGLNRNGRREFLSIVIHCSASNRMTTTPAEITAWHKARGWATIGYHKVITGDGKVHQGREDRLMGAGAEGWNEDSLHVCVTGNFDLDKMTKDHPQYKALVQVVATLANRHGIRARDIIGHRDVYTRLGQPQKKSCPGASLYDLLDDIRVEVRAYRAKGGK